MSAAPSQGAESAGSGRLRDVEPRRRSPKMTFLGDRQEVAQVPQLHYGDSYHQRLNGAGKRYWTPDCADRIVVSNGLRHRSNRLPSSPQVGLTVVRGIEGGRHANCCLSCHVGRAPTGVNCRQLGPAARLDRRNEHDPYHLRPRGDHVGNRRRREVSTPPDGSRWRRPSSFSRSCPTRSRVKFSCVACRSFRSLTSPDGANRT